jgi:hypothetical protein
MISLQPSFQRSSTHAFRHSKHCGNACSSLRPASRAAGVLRRAYVLCYRGYNEAGFIICVRRAHEGKVTAR